MNTQTGRKVVSGIGILIAIVLFCLGIFTTVPNKKIGLSSLSDDGYKAYVGGDAYNIQIEAALRGGQIAGGMSQRAIYISASGLILVISLFGLVKKDHPSAVLYEQEHPIEEAPIPAIENTPDDTF